jgi:GT2 family glycosyltransferase
MPEDVLVVVIVAYGAPELLADCLAALEGKHRVIVVDNSSSARVRSVVDAAGASYRNPGRNLGFAAGVNLVLEELALPDTDVLLLNPDATIVPSSIARLRARLEECPRLACVGPRERQPCSGVEQRVAWPFPTLLGGLIEAIGFSSLRRGTDSISGAVLLLRGEALVEIGGFDERFFLYYEDIDWERRASRLGWGTAICDGAWATHIGAATDSDQVRHELRVRAAEERYVRKHYGCLGWMSYRLVEVVGAIGRAIVLKGARRRVAAKRAWAYARGPDLLACKAGAVPPPVPRVPDLSRPRN